VACIEHPECYDLDDLLALLADNHDIKLSSAQLEVALDDIGVEVIPRLTLSGGTLPQTAPQWNPKPEQVVDDGFLDSLTPQERSFIESHEGPSASASPPPVVGGEPPAQHVVGGENTMQNSLGINKASIDLAARLPPPAMPPIPAGGLHMSSSLGGALRRPN